MGDTVTGAAPEWQILNGDCLDVLRRLPADCIGAMVTDPPAGIGFMGKTWDKDHGGRTEWIAWLRSIMQECLRVLKPGAHALVWAIPRTSHWTATAIEEAGFEIRDVVTHHFGTGFPKSLNISKAIDAAAGAERRVIGSLGRSFRPHADQGNEGWQRPSHDVIGNKTAPATPAAAQWEGWGTALKPATEHWILARKPLIGTVAASVLVNGTGGLNIDACRIGTTDPLGGGRLAGPTPVGEGWDRPWMHDADLRSEKAAETSAKVEKAQQMGRWPANLVLSHSAECVPAGCAAGCPVAEIDGQSGLLKSGAKRPTEGRQGDVVYGKGLGSAPSTASEGSASRFFYVAKPSTSEREEGLAHLPKKNGADITNREEDSAGINNPRAGAGRTSAGRANHHPTVKSIALMSWLIKLVSPPGAIVLDPFSGSGTTGVAAVLNGWTFLGIEKEEEYAVIARARIEHAIKKLQVSSTVTPLAEATP